MIKLGLNAFFASLLGLAFNVHAEIVWNPGLSTHNGIAFVEVQAGVGAVEMAQPGPTNPAGVGQTNGSSYGFGFATTSSTSPSVADTNLAGTDLDAGTNLVLVFDKASTDQVSMIAMMADASTPADIGFRQLSSTQIEVRAKVVDPVLSESNNPDSVGAAFGMVIQLIDSAVDLDLKGTVFVSDMHYQDLSPPSLPDLPQSSDEVEGMAAGLAAKGISSITNAGAATFMAFMQESFFELARENGVDVTGESCLGYRSYVELTGSDDGFERLNSPIDQTTTLANFDTNGDGSLDEIWLYRITNSEWSEQVLAFGIANSNTKTATQYLQTTSASANFTRLHIVNSSTSSQSFTGSLYQQNGDQLGSTDQALSSASVASLGRLILTSADIETLFGVSAWSGPAMLEVKGSADFELMAKLVSPSGLISNTNCVRTDQVHNIEGFDSSDVTYVRFINTGTTTLTDITGSLYDTNGDLIGDGSQVLVDSLVSKAAVWRTRDNLSGIFSDTWNGEAMLKIDEPPDALRLLNLNLINGETFFNFSCYEAAQ
ncbi:MAG: hypothetical protein HOC70_16030 [Gammaproteobacteria bacterium]|jgi:hypothetical protein|nr:hypothetical protein [Gammaproteobacteria bacterium]MBT4494753.1 hypothetical protein [Gammaproteobacteria bacterium]MBT7371115.1 hypothetical protein [Gammaproteobacteria bacterium]